MERPGTQKLPPEIEFRHRLSLKSEDADCGNVEKHLMCYGIFPSHYRKKQASKKNKKNITQ